MNKQSPLYIVLFVVIISVVFGSGISFVNYATLDMLKKNESLYKNRIITEAFMLQADGKGAEDYSRAIMDKLESFTITYQGKSIQAYRNREKGDVGFFISGRGFWDTVTGILVLSPELMEIRNLRIIEQKETPGLGARIEERWFTDQFKGLRVPWDDPVKARIKIKQASEAQDGRSFDAVTGATQTSLAVMNIINENLEIVKQSYRTGDK